MPNLTMNFAGRTAIVTGAARGLGLEFARLFHRSGATVFLVDTDAAEVAQAADELGATGAACDVTSTEAVEALVDRVVTASGRLDIIVNNAGILRDRRLWKLSDDDWSEVLDVHLGGTFRLTRAAVPAFRRQRYGRVINVTSYTGLRGNIGQANYGAAKAGIIGFTKTAAKELATFGVTVNAISPNAETRMIGSIPDEKRQELEAAIPLGRFAAPSEIAATTAFLASEEAGYITGVVLPVDGGISI
ncbi:3-oxoacyl-ACP reductase FabG [Actinoplanes sp. NBRC 103695]|uniref:3-oxoacyl-ACP reductase FabG n=1 Tax=Actinoplanes sp. NBRC 103695 TaxID=3032202 RepID=UPI0024A1B287|nr:3-oxoacyl-ACP reductase FabG [Actinoplanes sp. NBRC 103695]GLY98390.1 beta-ketoacyl-ACP reductase [Actinoplanes sp. NBRC 103695]